MQIGELARLAGCPVVTVRFYEKKGLLKQPERAGNNYRQYGKQDAERLKFILHCRKHGFNLREIAHLLALRETSGIPCDYAHTLVASHLSRIDSQIESLKALKQELQELSRNAVCHTNDNCPILRQLAADDTCKYCNRARG